MAHDWCVVYQPLRFGRGFSCSPTRNVSLLGRSVDTLALKSGLSVVVEKVSSLTADSGSPSSRVSLLPELLAVLSIEATLLPWELGGFSFSPTNRVSRFGLLVTTLFFNIDRVGETPVPDVAVDSSGEPIIRAPLSPPLEEETTRGLRVECVFRRPEWDVSSSPSKIVSTLGLRVEMFPLKIGRLVASCPLNWLILFLLSALLVESPAVASDFFNLSLSPLRVRMAASVNLSGWILGMENLDECGSLSSHSSVHRR